VHGVDPAGRFTDYYAAWLENLPDDVTIEGSLLDGAALGPEAVRTIVGAIRTLYDRQVFNFAGAYGDSGWLEDYTAQVCGEPMAVLSWSPATPPGKPSTSQRTTGHTGRCCSATNAGASLVRRQTAEMDETQKRRTADPSAAGPP
jgi:hypothetical protein